MAKIPPMPRDARCAERHCSATATTYRLTNEIVLTRNGVFEGVEWVCERHRGQDDAR